MVIRDRKPPAQRSKGSARTRRPKTPEPVRAWCATCRLPTYLPALPEKSPMFLDKRVYQGSSGRVYPMPFTDRIAETPTARDWEAVWLENAYLRVMVLPELGGRVHVLEDKTNGYDLIYRQDVIKPALVGLAGPWISGGIEFNWPQHHRPGTFLPVQYRIERHADGSVTLWCGDHDPLTRMKGLHGICLHPDRAVLEVKVRAYNRTTQVQTFLWWANAAVRVHEAYQSFFPPDVHYVGDHAKRAVTEYPRSQGCYYGVDYARRARSGMPASEVPARFIPPHVLRRSAARRLQLGEVGYAPNDLSFYANIPVPTSYMCLDSRGDFFGGYDHRAEAGLIHIANHHVAPGKKQWTWGNHAFGYAWDRNLTEPNAQGEYAPYIELMAGVYTDNQPDFSFLQPGETKTWSQFWYPIRKIGPAQHANLDVAVALRFSSNDDRTPVVRLGLSVTRPFPAARIRIFAHGRCLLDVRASLSPARPFLREVSVPVGTTLEGTQVDVTAGGRRVVRYQPRSHEPTRAPLPATEPLEATEIASVDELYLTGTHLMQYRHATRDPEVYWREGLRRDPGDARCHTALGVRCLERGLWAVAEEHLRRAIQRITLRNPNPVDGEPYYQLGWCLRFQSAEAVGLGAEEGDPRFAAAYAAFYKATWNQGWAAAAYHALAEMDCCRGQWEPACDHLERSLRFNADNLRARNLQAVVLRRLGRSAEATQSLRETRARDPLDVWARYLQGEALDCDLQTRLDLAHDLARAGFRAEAASLLRDDRFVPRDLPDQSWGARPLVHYTRGWLLQKLGRTQTALRSYRTAARLAPDYCFPSRLEEIGILCAAQQANPADARAPYYLGNLYYSRRRHEEALRCWEQAARLDPSFSQVWRNLGIGEFNIRRRPARARRAFDRALQCDPHDARLLYERDQLWKRDRLPPKRRLRALERRRDLVGQRDDLSVELCALYTQVGRPEHAVEVLRSRVFQPWEGGEGAVCEQHVRAYLALGCRLLAEGDPTPARQHFETALTVPRQLGESPHPLVNRSDIYYWLGRACSAEGEALAARRHWRRASRFQGDFQAMQIRPFSELTYYSGLALACLGERAAARRLFRDLLRYARALGRTEAQIDYFATSLPRLLLFEDAPAFRQQTTALLLEAQARLGLGEAGPGRSLLHAVLERDPHHARAAELLLELNRRPRAAADKRTARSDI